uniref:Uncharacterized protein n=1 Tax=Phasianus colchicus TaxID=9054 RepID=A0A669Q9P9_PHACC
MGDAGSAGRSRSHGTGKRGRPGLLCSHIDVYRCLVCNCSPDSMLFWSWEFSGLLLAWVLLRPAGAQQCHPSSPAGVLRFTDTHAEIRVPALHRVPSSLDPLYGLVRHYLDLIQQNPLPTELLRAALNNPSSVRASQRWHPTKNWGYIKTNRTPQTTLCCHTGGAVRAGLCHLCCGGSALHRGCASGRAVLLLLPESAAVRGPPACPPAFPGLPAPLPPCLPLHHLHHHPVSVLKCLTPKGAC